jgi:pimeloyl-ACP methyl ester carboxylesterase
MTIESLRRYSSRFLLALTFTILLAEAHCQEKYVGIEGQRFRIKTLGAGQHTVVFESGMSDSLEVWGAIPDSIARNAKVFLYDRAGIGKSDTSRLERTIPNMVFELRSLLRHEAVAPPYVLVGHSLGGLIARFFAGSYPSEVRALLLLDPAPESFWNSMSEEELRKYIEGGNEWYEARFPRQYRAEWYQFIPNLAYMTHLNIDKHLPIILVSATAWKWYKYHEDILAGYDHSQHIELEGEHHIFKNHPDLTVKYINELLGE